MIHAQLRHLHSPDVADLERYQPDSAEHFGILVQALIGPEKQEGEESFDLFVCTPSWLAEQVRDEGYVFGRHYVFLSRYDYHLLYQAIQSICDQAIGETWQVVAAYLGRYGQWEFEDYRDR